MGVGRFFFAALCTGYIMVGLTFEERDLVKHHDEIYLQYARRVPMLIPFLKFNQSGGGSKSELEKETA
jgi:protein-S-isoprenylcysteine O-methyltransferase Ste14